MDALTPESIFGGVILLAVISLLLSGKIRLEREVHAKDEVIGIKDATIQEQRKTIEVLMRRAEVTHHLLKEIRDAAYGHSSHEATTDIEVPKGTHYEENLHRGITDFLGLDPERRDHA